MSDIELIDVSHIYNKDKNNAYKALDNINISIKKGEYIAIVGDSGSGKSTLLNIIAGLLRPTSGTVFVDNIDIYKSSAKEIANLRNIKNGFIFQNFFLEQNFSVFENTVLPMLNGKHKNEDIDKRVNECLTLVGVQDKVGNLAKELSGGERQRVGIARALVNDPEYIFADEPTGNLDSTNSEQIMKILKELNKTGKTIFLITHNINQTKDANQIITIKDGKIINHEKK